MRKVISLVLLISGLAVGCGNSGSDDTKSTGNPATADDAGGGNGGNANSATNSDPNGGSNSGIPIPGDASAGGEVAPLYPMCDRAKAVAALGPAGTKWTGDAPFTMSQLTACLKKCPKGEFTCIQTMCEGGMEFSDCFNGEVGVCAAVGNDALCKTEWENLGCCVTEKKCDLTSQAGASACVGGSGPCSMDLGTFQTCSGNCQTAAQKVCVRPDPVGGATGGATDTDAAVPAGPGGGTAGGTTTIPATFMSGAPLSAFSGN